jgi:pimeloyl-ACP methyl ester carboxylesterase
MKNMSMVAAAEVRSIAAALVLVLLAAEMLSAGPALRAQSSPDAVADALVDIGGRRLHVSCTGVGSPTVILEAGMGDSAATWKAIHPGVAEFTRVCAYDRAARGRSDPDTRTQLRTAGTVVEDLSLLLGKVPIAGPYVLVGHSFGGAYVRGYAKKFPKDVVGMVLIDSTHEDQYGRFSSTGYVLPPMPPGENPERVDIMAALEEIRKDDWRADIPLAVLTHGRAIAQAAFPGATPQQATRIEGLWLDLQRELASRSSQGRLIVAEKSGHYVHLEEPALVIQAIRDVVAAGRQK